MATELQRETRYCEPHPVIVTPSIQNNGRYNNVPRIWGLAQLPNEYPHHDTWTRVPGVYELVGNSLRVLELATPSEIKADESSWNIQKDSDPVVQFIDPNILSDLSTLLSIRDRELISLGVDLSALKRSFWLMDRNTTPLTGEQSEGLIFQLELLLAGQDYALGVLPWVDKTTGILRVDEANIGVWVKTTSSTSLERHLIASLIQHSGYPVPRTRHYRSRR